MEPRNASVAVIGAGDYIGEALVPRFAAEGYVVFAGRRNGNRLEPLREEIEAARDRTVTRSLDAPSPSPPRELGPQVIHVAHLVIDAGVDAAWVRERRGNAPVEPGELMRPEAVAEAYWALHQQPRDAWTFEQEIPLFGETW